MPRTTSSVRQHKRKTKRTTLSKQNRTEQKVEDNQKKQTNNDTDNKPQQKYRIGTVRERGGGAGAGGAGLKPFLRAHSSL